MPPSTATARSCIGGNRTLRPVVFKGRIDEVRIYNRALSAGEIGADAGAPIQTPQQGPIAAYSFDEGEGETVEDLTGNGHTATIHGAAWTDPRPLRRRDRTSTPKKKTTSRSRRAPKLDGNEELTVEAWVRPSEARYLGEIAMKEREGSGAKYSWTLDQHLNRTRRLLHADRRRHGGRRRRLGATQHLDPRRHD